MSNLRQFLRGAANLSYSNASSGLTATTVQAAIDELDLSVDGALTDISNLETLSGVSGAVDLGTFTGTTISDTNTTKGALQELETSLETKAADADVIKKDGSVVYTAAQDMGGFKITNLATPTASTDGATKGYVDSVSAGLDPKESVRVATTANIADLAAGAPNVVDGITLVAGDRVLVKDQTTQTLNGLYVVTTAGTGSDGAWVRSDDHDGSPANEVSGGNYTFVEQGTISANLGFVLTGDGNLTLGVDNIIWTQFTGAGSFNAGAGLSQSGSDLDVNVDDATIEINADTLRVKANGVGSNEVDFGFGAGQISAANVPIVDVGGLITAANVDEALTENRTAIDALEDNTITSPNGSVSVAGTVGGDDQTVDVVFSSTGAANRSIQASDLASTANGLGASMAGIEDSAGIITATTVEGALAENRTALDAIEDNTITSPNGSLTAAGTVGGDDQTLDVNFSTTGAANRSIEASALASATNGEGASMVGIEDSAGNYTATDVEGVLTEIDGRLDTLESGGTLDWAIKTSAYTAVDGDKLLVDTTSGVVTITLPLTPSAGDEVIVRDAKRTSETNAITVARNGSNIGGLAEDMTIAIDGVQTHLVYVDAGHGWSVNAT